MTFNNIIIGGGVAGLFCGITLQNRGLRTLIISSGESALHFSSGSFDLLSQLPDGKEVLSPLESYDSLVAMNPNHPYAKLTESGFAKLALQAAELLSKADITTHGTASINHLRLSPLGKLCPTWLSLNGFITSKQVDSMKGKRVLVIAYNGLQEYYPHRIADTLRLHEIEVEVITTDLPTTTKLSKGDNSVRLPNIARSFDQEEFIATFANRITQLSQGYDDVIIPDAVGFDNNNALAKLTALCGKPIHIAAIFPPSVTGIRTQRTLRRQFEKLGGTYIPGDKVSQGVITNNKVTALLSDSHGNTPFCAKNVVLASGSFFSKGLCSSPQKVFEPLFNIDLFHNNNNREAWYNDTVFQDQPYNSFGAVTNAQFQTCIDGQTIENLYACGSILGGYDPLTEGSGAGVAMLTAIAVAHIISEKQ